MKSPGEGTLVVLGGSGKRESEKFDALRAKSAKSLSVAWRTGLGRVDGMERGGVSIGVRAR